MIRGMRQRFRYRFRRRIRSETLIAAAYFLGLAVLVFYPSLGPGYLLSLDMVVVPEMNFLSFGLDGKDPLYYGRLPVLAAFDALGLVIPAWAIQQLALIAIVAGGGFAMYTVLHGRSPVASLFAGTVYAINPFVYARLLAGHWFFLLGYAALPLAVMATASFLRSGSGKGWVRLRRAARWTTVVALFDPHAFLLLGVLAWLLALMTTLGKSVSSKRTVARRFGTYGVVAVGINAFWLLPAVHALFTGTSLLSSVTSVDLAAFSARGTVGGNVPLSVATLYGFWRGGAIQPVDLLGLPVAIVLYAVVLFFAVYGWHEHREEAVVRAISIAALIGFVMAMGLSHPVAAPVTRWLFEHVLPLRGMRDTQKFAALLALAYAYLGGLGLDSLAEEFLETCRSGRLDWFRGRYVGPDRRATLAVVFVLIVLLVPMAYSVTMFGGLWGQLEPTDYPAEWEQADDYLDGDSSDYRVLFLPWHQYMDFSFTDRTVATPADLYFDERVVRGRNIELAGIESQATDPTRVKIRSLLAAGGESTDLGSELSTLGVKYVMLGKEVDYERYDYLQDDAAFDVVLENDRLILYENKAFSNPNPGAWPRVGPLVPWTSLAVGTGVSVLALVGLLDPNRVRAVGGRAQDVLVGHWF